MARWVAQAVKAKAGTKAGVFSRRERTLSTNAESVLFALKKIFVYKRDNVLATKFLKDIIEAIVIPIFLLYTLTLQSTSSIIVL